MNKVLLALKKVVLGILFIILVIILVVIFVYTDLFELFKQLVIWFGAFLETLWIHGPWASVMLIFLYFYKPFVEELIKACTQAISRLLEVKWNNFRLMLKDKDVPVESKILLTQCFIEQDRIRAAAASDILYLFRVCIDNVCEIITQPALYMHEENYPFKIPAIKNNNIPIPERPSRLVFNEFGSLKAGLNKPISQIVGEESLKVLNELNLLELLIRQINGSLQAHFGDHPDKKDIQKNYKSPTEYVAALREILKKIEEIVTPIINSEK